jgi:hypothetical protein
MLLAALVACGDELYRRNDATRCRKPCGSPISLQARPLASFSLLPVVADRGVNYRPGRKEIQNHALVFQTTGLCGAAEMKFGDALARNNLSLQ